MKFGIYLPNFGSYGEARVLANLAQDAENSGWIILRVGHCLWLILG
jgi:hypothetical protein